MMGKTSSLCCVFLLTLLVDSLYTIPLTNGRDSLRREAEHDFDAEIEEITKREYETVHGRILAVNMAHNRMKRQVSGNVDSRGGSAYQEIEEANRGNMTMLFEGDIQLDDELEREIKHGPDDSRNAVRERKRLWKDRIIPYRIPSWMSHIRLNLLKAIREIEGKTCLRFTHYNGRQRNYITFNNNDGCSSRVGLRYASRGMQEISIAQGCNHVATIVHELLHALGFLHEQSRSDRDKFVKIYWENILPGLADQFDKYSWRTIDDLGVSYDYQSIMHYDRRAFTKDGSLTIAALGNENMELGNTNGRLLSYRDVVELNSLYDCRKKSLGWTTWSGWTPCDSKCYRKRERFCYHSGNVKSCGGNVNTYGIEYDRVKCPSSICPAPVDGHWGRWSEWSSCSKTCNDGRKRRFRRCNNPEPKHGGQRCPGISTKEEMCTVKRCRLGFDDTDFEYRRLGMWRNLPQANQFYWQFHKFHTKSMNTGPSGDHTTGKGYYLYVESSGRRRGQRAEIFSNLKSASAGGECLKFFYNMYGTTMGSLAVKLEVRKNNKRNSWYIFYKSGNQGTGWKKGTGNINVAPGSLYKLSIIATVGGVYSDIAIDDVYIDPGLCSCQDDYFTCHLWAQKGECTKNREWMRDHCHRSCKVCGVPTSPPPCVDKDPTQCPLWTANGECRKNPGFMMKNCCKSCARAGPNCKDSNSVQCPLWAANGECSKNSGFMKNNCKRSCRTCG
ncbi:uncharacterized protein [Montipora capricornis]|uniref:uncharacterized protein n=1 Tax=Montipora capricornis TaxID=246305 RepID=UPI0035F1D72E